MYSLPYRFSCGGASKKAKLEDICIGCHADVASQPLHQASAEAVSCVECHGSHDVRAVKQIKDLPINQYCLSCHNKEISIRMKNGERLSAKVNEADILDSAHKDLSCIRCHEQFSTSKHPITVFESVIDYRAGAKRICSGCHKAQASKYKGSIHETPLSNIQFPDCLACHDYHKVSRISPDKSLRICEECHGREFKAFAESAHNKAFLKGKENAPICSSCHGAHDVLPVYSAELDRACIRCHKDVETTHKKWLWNPPLKLKTFTEVHFNSTACAACHVVDNKAIYLSLIREGKVVTAGDIAKALGVEVGEVEGKVDLNGDGRLDKEELWKLRGNIEGSDFVGKIDVIDPNDAHRIKGKEEAIKECEAYHSPRSKLRGAFEIDGAKPVKFEVDKEALSSAYAIPNISGFYVLGGTKVKIFDIAFFAALGAAVVGAVGHVALRILATPIRRRKAK